MMIKDNSSIHYIGCDDLDLDLFENQYIIPEGMAYNSYVIDDEKLTIMDTIDVRKSEEWQGKLREVLAGREPSYLVVQHLEPDHSANVAWVMQNFKNCQVVCSARAASMMCQFFDFDFSDRILQVKEGDKLELGKHNLTFYAAPMVHWPEVIVSYESTEKVLFSADGFGKFGALCNETDDWACEARRYYFNICGKYGSPVQTLLKKAATLDIQTICPLHGPILKENLGYYLGLYDTWSKYEPETKGVFIAYATLHGNTGKAAKELAEMLEAKGVKVAISDLSRADVAECVEDAFRYDRMVLAASTYDGGLMPLMKDFLGHLSDKTYQNRKVALVENGSWAPAAARIMRSTVETFKNVSIIDKVVTIKTTLNENTRNDLKELTNLLAE
ncbi:MAG: FprA family A-type flavoprotein [Paludibacteraceae bacterium]|nr:FprA family A-type flavoprotein [Paludibacteraceae bacterium]